jgi:hypothetical protein
METTESRNTEYRIMEATKVIGIMIILTPQKDYLD